MRIQTTRDSASTFISGIRFAAHPNPPQGGKLLVSEPVDPDDDSVKGLLSLDGFEQAPDYGDAVLDAVDDAIDREKSSAQTAVSAAVNQTIEGLEAANHNLARTVGEQRETIAGLERQLGETAVGELRDEITRLQERVRDAEAKAEGADPGREPTALEAENARLRTTNETLGTENGALREELAAVKAENDKLAADLKAAQELLDADDAAPEGEGAAPASGGRKKAAKNQ